MTWFDLLVIVVLALSIGFAAVRGAIREFATLIALGGAALISYFSFNPLLGALGLKGSIFGMIGLAGVLLVLFFILLYIAFHFGLKRVNLSSNMLLADRIGGGAFGLVRGLALIGLSFLGYAYYQDEENRPPAVKDAFFLPVAQGTATFFENLAPHHDSQDIISPDEIDEKINAASEGYGRGDRAALDEIVATTSSSDPENQPTEDNNLDSIEDILVKETDSGR